MKRRRLKTLRRKVPQPELALRRVELGSLLSCVIHCQKRFMYMKHEDLNNLLIKFDVHAGYTTMLAYIYWIPQASSKAVHSLVQVRAAERG